MSPPATQTSTQLQSELPAKLTIKRAGANYVLNGSSPKMSQKVKKTQIVSTGSLLAKQQANSISAIYQQQMEPKVQSQKGHLVINTSKPVRGSVKRHHDTQFQTARQGSGRQSLNFGSNNLK